MKIAIYEIIHLECILPWCELIDGLGHEVSVFTLEVFKGDIENSLGASYFRFNWNFIKADAGIQQWIPATRSFFKKHYDIVLLSSVDAHHLIIYKLLQNKSSSLLINLHDVNNFLRPSYPISLRQIIRTIGKRLLLNRAEAFIVNAEEMRNYIKTERLTRKPVYCFAPVYSKARFPNLKHGNITVVIPGSIDNRRRNYHLALNSWRMAGNKEVTLILAGQPVGDYGQEVLTMAENLKEEGFSIQTFQREVPEAKFQKLIAETSFLLSPLVLQTSIHDNIHEEYGRSKFSGNIYDAIRHGKPLFLPFGIQAPIAFRNACLFFKNETDLADQLGILRTSKAIQEFSKTAYENSINYSKSIVQQKLTRLLNTVINAKT